MKWKLFLISFCIMFVSTATICILTKQPLIFLPVDYSAGAFLRFAILITILCFLMVFISLPFLDLLKPKSRTGNRNEGFFLPGIIIILQLVTMIIGYTESSLTRGIDADWFYYYKGVGNSFIYILTGNITSLIAASFYATEQYKRKKEESIKKLELERE